MTSANPPTIGDRRVMIVDPDQALGGLMARYLAAQGWTVAVAESDRDALRSWRVATPSVFLVDLRDGDMDAFDLLGAVAALPDHPPIVLVAGEAGQGLRQVSLAPLGVVAVLARPAPFATVDRVLRAAWQWWQARLVARPVAGRGGG